MPPRSALRPWCQRSQLTRRFRPATSVPFHHIQGTCPSRSRPCRTHTPGTRSEAEAPAAAAVHTTQSTPRRRRQVQQATTQLCCRSSTHSCATKHCGTKGRQRPCRSQTMPGHRDRFPESLGTSREANSRYRCVQPRGAEHRSRSTAANWNPIVELSRSSASSLSKPAHSGRTH